MNIPETLIAVSSVVDMIAKLQTLVANAQESGQTQIELSPLQAAFAALDAAEADLDKAIDEAKQSCASSAV